MKKKEKENPHSFWEKKSSDVHFSLLLGFLNKNKSGNIFSQLKAYCILILKMQNQKITNEQISHEQVERTDFFFS